MFFKKSYRITLGILFNFRVDYQEGKLNTDDTGDKKCGKTICNSPFRDADKSGSRYNKKGKAD